MVTATTRTIGDVTVTRVEESFGPGFAPDLLFPDWDPAVVDEHRAWMVPGCYDETAGRFIASVHSWVLRTARHTIVIDTCAGNHKDRPAVPRFHQQDQPFLARLAAAGVAPEAVDYVLCTHLHVDHVGWNTRLDNGRWVPTFPNARHVFSKAEQEHWAAGAGSEGVHAGVYEDSVLPVVAAGLAEVVDGAAEVAGGLLLAPTPGHSPGHVAVRLLSGGEEAVFSGDIMHQPIQVYRPEWNSRFCADAAAARASRRWLLEHCVSCRATLFPAHFPGTHVGRVNRRGERFTWEFT